MQPRTLTATELAQSIERLPTPPAARCSMPDAHRTTAPLKIYGTARTVVDCFKFRNKLGLDVARIKIAACANCHPQGRALLLKK